MEKASVGDTIKVAGADYGGELKVVGINEKFAIVRYNSFDIPVPHGDYVVVASNQ